MEKLVEAYIKSEKLLKKNDKILLAVSGGCDSVTLTHILNNLKYKITLAHCNFKLRTDDSDKDEAFVKELANELNLPIFVESFKTNEFAKQNNYSVEEAARILRYNWFEEIRIKQSIDFIAVAHHLDDKIETFFINLTAGTGIRGIRSIKPKNNKIVRPLLFAKRKDIELWCSEKSIPYRIDKSNFETDFTRNKFRHKILPIFNEINPAFSDAMFRNFEIFTDIEKIYNEHIVNASKKIITHHNNLIYLKIDKLLSQVASKTVLFEIVHSYGFNSAQTNDIIRSLDKMQGGKEFISDTYRLIKDRKHLIIKKKSLSDTKEYIIEQGQSYVNSPLPLQFEIQKYTSSFKILKNKYIAYFDADKIAFPLKIRIKKNGDTFYPFGMKGKKLLSDYFTDIKLNLFEKEECRLLLSGNDIIWIIGYRTDERYKITNKTKQVLIIKRQ